MSKRPGNKKTVGAWVTPEMQAAIDEWRRRRPAISQSAFAQMAYAELLRKDGIKIEDAAVFRDGRVRDPNSNERPGADQLLGLAGDIANPLPSTDAHPSKIEATTTHFAAVQEAQTFERCGSIAFEIKGMGSLGSIGCLSFSYRPRGCVCIVSPRRHQFHFG